MDNQYGYSVEFAEQVNDFLEPASSTYDDLIARFPAIEAQGQGYHVDSRGIATTGIGLTAIGANDFAERLGFPKWNPPSGFLKPGINHTAKGLRVPWSPSQQQAIAKEKLKDADRRLKDKGVRMPLIPKSLRMAALDLIYNAQDAAFAYKGNETAFIKNLREFSNMSSLQRTPEQAFSVMKETLDIIKSNDRYALGLVKRRVRWLNETAQTFGFPAIQRFHFDRESNAVKYIFDNKVPGSNSNELQLGKMSKNYDILNADDNFENPIEVRIK